MIVFLQAGLYAPRERRAGAGRILAALVLVALIVLAFGARHGLRLHDDRADPDRRRHVHARDRRPPRGVRLGLARADAVRRDPPPAAPRRRGRDARRPRAGAARRPGRDRDRRDRHVRARAGPLRPRLLPRAARASCSSASGRTSSCSPRPTSTSSRCSTSSSSPTGRACAVKLAPTTTELLVHEGEYVPGRGRAALRAAAADPERRRVGRRSGRSTSSSRRS